MKNIITWILGLFLTPLAVAQTAQFGPLYWSASSTGAVQITTATYIAFPAVVDTLNLTITALNTTTAWTVNLYVASSPTGPWTTNCPGGTINGAAITVSPGTTLNLNCKPQGAAFLQIYVTAGTGGGQLVGSIAGTNSSLGAAAGGPFVPSGGGTMTGQLTAPSFLATGELSTSSANSTGVDVYTGLSRFMAFGPNSSTYGSIGLWGYISTGAGAALQYMNCAPTPTCLFAAAIGTSATLNAAQASTTYLDYYSGYGRLFSSGPNSSTAGGFTVIGITSTGGIVYTYIQCGPSNGNCAFDGITFNGDSSATFTHTPRSVLPFSTGQLASIVSGGQYFAGNLAAPGVLESLTATAASFVCTTNPTITLEDCGTSAGTCSSPTTLASVTLTAANTITTGTVTSATLTAGHYFVFATTAGACTVLNASGSAEYHMS